MGIFDKPKAAIPPTTKGVEHAVPCPHCGKPNDMRELDAHQVDKGDEVACDHCDGVMQIQAKQRVTVIHVRRLDKKMPRQAGPGGATTISAAQARRMIGRG